MAAARSHGSSLHSMGPGAMVSGARGGRQGVFPSVSSSCRLVRTSLVRGTRCSTTVSLHKSVAANMGSTLFFAAGNTQRPCSGVPPTIRYCFIAPPPHAAPRRPFLPAYASGAAGVQLFDKFFFILYD